MLIEDTQIVKPFYSGGSSSASQIDTSEGSNGTVCITKARIVSNTGWENIRSRIENFGIRRFKDNTIRSANGLRFVLEKLKERIQH